MLYGGPLGPYLSGYYAPGSTKSGSPSFTNTGSGPTSSGTGFTRTRSGRYRAPSAYGTPSSGGGGGPSSSTLTTPSSNRSNFYTPQTRRKYSDDKFFRASSSETPTSSNWSRYGPSATPVSSEQRRGSITTTPTGPSGYYSRPSPSTYNSPPSFTSSSASTANPVSSVPPSSTSRAATLSPYYSVSRRTQSYDRVRRNQSDSKYFSALRPSTVGDTSGLDYKRLYEAEKQETTDLRAQIDEAQAELRELQNQMAMRSSSSNQTPATPPSATESERRILEELRAEWDKLKAEHRALTRVITRLM